LDIYRLAARWRSNGRSVRVALSFLVAAILTPALLLGGWLTLRSAEAECEQMKQILRQQAREIELEIDREIASTVNILTALASSYALHTDDLEAFRRQILGLSQQLDVQIVLRDPARNTQLINTGLPQGTFLRQMPPARVVAEEEMLRTMKPVVSNVFFAPLVKRHVVAVLVPVLREGYLAYVLSIGIPTDKFTQFLAAAAGPEGRAAAILDRDRVFVARSEQHSELTGRPIRHPDLLSGVEGVRATTNWDGTPFHWFYRHSATMGWTFAVGVPTSVLHAPAERALMNYLAASAVLLIAAVALAFGFGNWISRWSGRLGIDRQPTREEFRVLFESSPNGVLLVDSAGVILLVNAPIENYFGYARGELVGRPVEVLLPEQLRAGHGHLREGFAAAPQIRQMGAGRDLYGRRKDGTEFPVEVGLNPISAGAGNLVMATVVDIS
jgi:PAS domain S-box-containing protein